MIAKSKLQYVRAYVDSVDPSVYEAQKIDREKLYKLLASYYEAVSDEK